MATHWQSVRGIFKSWLRLRGRLTFNLVGFLILLVGFGGADFIWRAQDRVDRQDIERSTNEVAVVPLAPDDSRRYKRDVELYYGTTGLLLDKWTRRAEELAHGKSLANTIAALSFVTAGGCFLVAGISKARPGSE